MMEGMNAAEQDFGQEGCRKTERISCGTKLAAICLKIHGRSQTGLPIYSSP
jgi:hypothetical protein